MDQRNESTHDRLNRELRRRNLRDRGVWAGWAVAMGALAIFGFVSLNVPINARYVEGIAGQTMSLPTEDTIRLMLRVQVEGRMHDVTLASQLVHPAPGDPVCLRASQYRFTGHTAYHIASQSLCNRPTATQNVD